MPRLDNITLRCKSPSAQIAFYRDILGMTVFDNETVGYDGPDASIRFIESETPYKVTPNDLYWKIAIAVPDIELAYEQLTQKGVSVSKPHQFQDIGYLAHFTDPEGFTIELINHVFKGQNSPKESDVTKLGGGPSINLLTLRTENIEKVREACSQIGMKALSVQKVEPNRFTLYFYAFSHEHPPSNDLIDIVNRPWLYQRPYTVLELQSYSNPAPIVRPNPSSSGYSHATLSGISLKNTQANTLACFDALQIEFSELAS